VAWDWWWSTDTRANIETYNGGVVKTPYSFYFGLNYFGPASPPAPSYSSLWPTTVSMRKASDTFTPSVANAKSFRVLLSDATYSGGVGNVYTAHLDLRRTGYIDGGGGSSYFNWNSCLQYFAGSEVTANYGLDDLSVKTYTFNPSVVTLTGGYFTRFKSGGVTYMVPSDLGQ
jgi:hypothetical protein